MRGKERCRALRRIREEIARSNGIDLEARECTHRGECSGTCPRCEGEVRYLEAELEKRRRLKKTIALAGVSAGIAAALTGCSVIDALTDAATPPETAGIMPAPTEEVVLMGEIVAPPEELEGDVSFPEPGGGEES